MSTSTLFGIGIGPGDPELITVKAVKVLSQVDIVFAAASTKNSYSIAWEIASPYLREGVPLVQLGFPMTRDKKRLETAWEENVHKIHSALMEGRDAAFITIGDPLTYSTFGYIMDTMKKRHPEVSIQVIPGVTSYQAAAAAAQEVLAEGEESLCVVSGALGPDRLKEIIRHTDNVVIVKVYRHYREILDVLNGLDLSSRSVLISRCGLPGEEIVHDPSVCPDRALPYLSLILIRGCK
jgi:precorrin-2/cobalt-factor-2 C20-methyltransferase